MTPTNKTYTFSSLKELFETVPADRIEDCMLETTFLMLTLKTIEQQSGETISLPDTLAWIDDGTDELDLKFKNPKTGEVYANLHTKLNLGTQVH